MKLLVTSRLSHFVRAAAMASWSGSSARTKAYQPAVSTKARFIYASTGREPSRDLSLPVLLGLGPDCTNQPAGPSAHEVHRPATGRLQCGSVLTGSFPLDAPAPSELHIDGASTRSVFC